MDGGAGMDDDEDNLLDSQIDDFDQNMMDEASINYPDEH